jgi:putative addiction module component (TIGR02574 family)
MSALLEKVRAETEALSPDERMLLGVELIDSVCVNPQASVTEVEDAWDEEIARRVEDVRAGKVDLVPWSEVVSQTNAKFGWDS